MRLLHFDELGKFILTDFHGKTTPPYAILSHRWSGSEVLIEDIVDGAYQEREEGQKKLQFCAKQAAQDGLEYFWVDTCCIDKWNLRELSKAINSMFRWYKNAAQCYVFLSDVSTNTPECNDWETSFRASTWFTRGWTLQELIAPVSVKFFSREGLYIGDKTSLISIIHDITNIPLAALQNCPLEDFTTSERMQWAKNRRTKEEEDIVYCLLGILGVSIPIVYGEGQESAQRKLQAELEAAGNAPSIIPFSQNPRFVGQESQLAEVEARLFSNKQSTTTLAIVGPGGIGKSQLALEVAHRTRQMNGSCSVFWIDASNKDRLYHSYTGVAQKLSIPGWDEQADMEQLIQRCMTEMSARHCLLVFDNAEDTTLQSSGSSDTGTTNLTDFLPQSKLCSAVFTTTNSDTAHTLASQNIIRLQELTPDMALKMLIGRLARPLSNIELQEAEHLLRELLYLPLAVVQAAACMNASSMTVQEYRSQLNEHKETVIELGSDSFESDLQSSSGKIPVAATLSLSIDQIRRDNSLAADYLFLAACVDRKDISIDLLEATSTQLREDALKVLDKYSLITRRPADSALDVHRLVHQALREQLEAQGQLEQWTQFTVTQLYRVFPNDDHSNRSKWRRLLPHAQYALSYSRTVDDNKKTCNLRWKCAVTLYSDGRYKEAEELMKQVMQTKKRLLGDEDPSILVGIVHLASTYKYQGRWGEAEELEVQVIPVMKRVLGDRHNITFVAVNNLAMTYMCQERWKDAQGLQEYIVKTLEEELDEGHPSMLTAMSNLATTYESQGLWREAEDLQVKVLKAREKTLGEEHPDTLLSMSNRACTLHSQGRHKEAFALMEKCFRLYQHVLGNQHLRTQSSLDMLEKWRAQYGH